MDGRTEKALSRRLRDRMTRMNSIGAAYTKSQLSDLDDDKFEELFVAKTAKALAGSIPIRTRSDVSTTGGHMTTEKTPPRTSVHSIILLLCPCCGHRAELEDIPDEYGPQWSIECDGCGLGLTTGISPDVIARAWNARRTDAFKRWIEGEIAKLGVDVMSYHRGRALRECHGQLKKLLNGLGLDLPQEPT